MKMRTINKTYLFITIFLFIGIVIYNTNAKSIKEGIENNPEKLFADPAKSFCQTFNTDSSNLQNACGKLTGANCRNSECCVLSNGKKCLAGNANGPTFKTNDLKNYYYMGKCYGKGCGK
ncbi:MAG: hypothetical protein EB127_11300 [Alphaproteobacteria bacterium]|nr:hypothetical protein [Alphaproteobacteria bacterium]